MGIESGGGTGRTSWDSTPIPMMWAALKDYDSAPHWRMTGAWRQSYELLIAHIGQVKQYRDNLAAAWPPHRSKAAAAYVQELDGLIENLEETYEAAIVNHQALSTATSAISEARRELEAVHTEYESNQTLLAEYEKELTSWSAKYTPPENPLADGQQAALQSRAARIMQSLSAELATAQTSFIAPRPYTAAGNRGAGEELVSPSGGGGAGGGPGFAPRSITPPARSGSVTPPAVGEIAAPAPAGQGPTLVGTTPAPVPAAPNPGLPTAPVATPTVPPGAGGPFPLTPVPGNSPPRLPVTGGGVPTRVGSPPTNTGVRGGPFPGGGVIGGSPATGGGSPTGGGGRPMSGGAGPMSGGGGPMGGGGRPVNGGPQRVNPTGGMIGGPGAGGSGRPGGPGAPGGMGGPGGRRHQSDVDGDPQNRRWDPDNPWETDIGVDPVLLPAREQRIDPGPTIGGR
ncbi:coiled-coil domain-containing protein [Actinoplanes sp. G11-F43]|uniref:coiled-coil domain-containing protein n=1 Tax=Actinoplanes sp. G11-F43 TaxID=3424130 RepID=UPI003D33CFB7